MAANIVEDPKLRNRSFVFEDREAAGAYLAQAMEQYAGKDALVLAIPSGGVPIGLAISSHLDLPFDMLIIRKIPVPGNPEAGLGAMSLEGDIILNDRLVSIFALTREDIEELAEPVRAELQARDRIFRGGKPWPEIKGKVVILADDGLASGYTMVAATRMVRRKRPKEIVLAVPTASADAVLLLSREVDTIFCPNIRSDYRFAVAEAYRNWYDLSKEDVLAALMKHGFLSGD
jgi:putative phosphoribosyl transferase